jgi:hypothetical protein
MTQFLMIENDIININSITVIELRFNTLINRYILKINMIGDRVKSFRYNEREKAEKALRALAKDLAAIDSCLCVHSSLRISYDK